MQRLTTTNSLPTVVINAIELFHRHYPYDPMSADEWKHYVLPDDTHVFFRVKQRVEGRTWRLEIKVRETTLIDVESQLDPDESRKTHSYLAGSSGKAIVTALSTIQLGWPDPPTRISGPLA